MREAVLARCPAAMPSSWPPRWPTSGRARPPTAKLARADGLHLELEPTEDILAEAAAMARDARRRLGRPRPLIVGFAAETGSLERAPEKAARKRVDLMVANDVSEPGSGFGTDDEPRHVHRPGQPPEPWPLATKAQVAHELLDRLVARPACRARCIIAA